MENILEKEFTIDPTEGKYKKLFNTNLSNLLNSEKSSRNIRFMGINFKY